MKYCLIIFVSFILLFSCTRMENTDLYKKLKNAEPIFIPITFKEDSCYCFLTSRELWDKWSIKMVEQCVFDSLLYLRIKNNEYIYLNEHLYNELKNDTSECVK
ncbi:MAG: hypothetical protein EGQ74_07135 [Bacteroides nordii]|nr:hypothetical protein HMPREF1214_04758 [Bacteroides sp. HPS0048]MBD9109947.1 hypothetical protein [Bacteroides nordii]MCE8463523.1 hypothetical protein [Bacteroides nordii]